uniref:DNA-directed DNA polymerase n=1 Tax=Meloidogyne incognita TaxID=6306 RepID=A0A914MMX8_MELIC
MIRFIRNLDRSQYYEYIHGRYGQRGKFEKDTLELMQQVGAPLGQKEYDAEIWVPRIVDYLNEKYTGQFCFKVFVFDCLGHYKPCFKYGPKNYNSPLLLYFDGSHFNGVSCTGGLFSQPYCLECETVYSHPKTHSSTCQAKCLNCSRVGPLFPCPPRSNFFKKCNGCFKRFNNENCFNHHLISNFCRTSKKCELCGVIWDYRYRKAGHVCSEKYCKLCIGFHDPKRGCFVRPLDPKEQKPYRIVAFDLETTQHSRVLNNNGRIHKPNFIAVKVTCPKCIEKEQEQCKICGSNKLVTFSERPFYKTAVDSQNVTTDPLVSFVRWIIEATKDYDTIAFSHFGGRFDMVIVFKELFLQGLTPEMLKNGNKMYEMKVRIGNKNMLIFRDSFNIMPMSLASLVPAFALKVEDKPFFPHLANHPNNYGKEIFPSPSDYFADGMMVEKRKEFDRWYQQNKELPFLLDEALAAYCVNDVEILLAALLAFRSEFIEVTKRAAGERAASSKAHGGIDILRESMTIASACMNHFRTNHLKENHLALVPEKGYDNAENQRKLALKFMKWYEGEYNIGNYKLDGWIEEEKLGIEINGCAWHGCERCYPEYNIVLPNGIAAGKQREKDQFRLNFIKSQGINVRVFCECEIRRMLDRNREMKKKFRDYLDNGPINIRSCFFGGRTGPLQLFYSPKEGEIISYYDVTSLYPFINVTTKYPVGHPQIHIVNKDVQWSKPEDNIYELAILKVFVIPPRSIDVAILPMKIGDDEDERLLFPLCSKCAKENPEGGVNENYSCPHSDQQRGWVSTCTSIELNVALEEGYRVTKLFRVLEFRESDDKLFAPYISEFMAAKIHSSGFDSSIKDNFAAEEQFIKECKDKFGINIERSKMGPNKGKRTQAKLMLNNLWGRFSLRNVGLSQCAITNNPAELRKYLDDRSIEVSALDELTPDILLITYSKKKDWVEEHACSNVVISLWTTSAARIHLLRAMQKVVRTPGCNLLYTDTDSLIFSHPSGNCPLQLGPHLGEFTNEYPSHEILEYCSGGAKQYGLKLRRKERQTTTFEYVLKVRGMTLNYDVIQNQGLRYDTFKEQVLSYARTGELKPINILYPNFLRPSIKDGCVISKPLYKMYKPVVCKGIIRPSDYVVLNFGHINNIPRISPP